MPSVLQEGLGWRGLIVLGVGGGGIIRVERVGVVGRLGWRGLVLLGVQTTLS